MTIQEPYREDLAYIHDVGHASIAADAAARLIDELARAGHRDGVVVDLGCGSGTLASLAAAAGYRVIGLDVSPAMIALARSHVRAAEFRVESFVSASIPPCVAVTAVGEVLNYCFDDANDDGARRDLFRRVYEALAPGGLFLFDVAGPARAPRDGRQRTFVEGPDWAVLVETSWDPPAARLTRAITSFRRIGQFYRRDTEIHRLVLLETDALLAALEDAGFHARTIASYGTNPLPRGVTAMLCGRA